MKSFTKYSRYSSEEKEFIKHNYLSLSKDELLKIFPNRSWKSIKNRANNCHVKKRYLWTEREISLLKEVFPKFQKNEILKLFKSKSWGAISLKASTLNIKRPLSWKDEEINILKEKFLTSSKEELVSLIPNRKWIYICHKAHTLGLRKFYPHLWTSKEKELLRSVFTIKPKSEILKLFPNKKWSAILKQGSLMGLKRIMVSRAELRLGDLSVLLEDKPETYYWIGFLLADGHFGKYHISLNSAEKDWDHINKFGKFISYSGKRNQEKSHLSISDFEIVPLINEKFKISNRKTYNPPDLSKIQNPDLLLSLIIGFVDGDGCIFVDDRRGYYREALVVGCYPTWIDNFIYFYDFLYKYSGVKRNPKHLSPRIVKKNLGDGKIKGVKIKNPCGYVAILSINDNSLLSFIKDKIIKLKLPVLDRKWSKVKLNLKSTYEEKLIKLGEM